MIIESKCGGTYYSRLYRVPSLPKDVIEKLRTMMWKSALSRTGNSCHGAVIVKGKEIIGAGYNDWRRRKSFTTPGAMKHAEMMAYEDALFRHGPKKLKGAKLVVTRMCMKYKDRVTLSMPCYDCMRRLRKTGITKIYWSTGNDDIPFGVTNL